MIGTYAAVVAVCVSSGAIGQAALLLCGVRDWSWTAPAVGLALVCAAAWGTVLGPGDGVASALLVVVLTVAALIYLRGRVEGAGEIGAVGGPVALVALLAVSLPFAVEGHFGILGTSFNPDMSQHLLAADRLAEGHLSQLQNQGYPLGPHSIVVALEKGLGIGLVQGFSGLTMAVAILACLTALAAFGDLPLLQRTAGAVLVGLAYIVASYFAQGAFKETMQALFFLAFVLALREADRDWSQLTLRYVPAALVAVGSVYTYSFPGLIWLGGTFAIWLSARAVSAAGGQVLSGVAEERLDLRDDRERSAGAQSARSETGPAARTPRPAARTPRPAARTPRPAARPLALALVAFLVLTLPELGRMLDFQRFETFDPNGPGLGNLFGQVSPFEALGVWPSGDFRLAPGDGAVPAVAYYLGIAFALVLLLYGIVRLWRGRETAILSGLAAAGLAYAGARLAGTPYTAAKAIEVGAPIVALAILLPLARRTVFLFPAIGGKGTPQPGGAGIAQRLVPAAGLVFMFGAGFCSLLALANTPVGPTSYSSDLSDYRKLLGEGPTLVVAPPRLLEEEHGVPFIAWELRGGRVCIRSTEEATTPPPGVRFVVRKDADWTLRKLRNPLPGRSPCPLIAERQVRQGPGR